MNAVQALEVSIALTEMQKYVERRFAVGGVGDRGIAPTGEPYVQFGPHLIEEGCDVPFFPSLEATMVAARSYFDAYSRDRSGSVYWRILPEVACYPEGWRFYMRLLISDKPQLPKEA